MNGNVSYLICVGSNDNNQFPYYYYFNNYNKNSTEIIDSLEIESVIMYTLQNKG